MDAVKLVCYITILQKPYDIWWTDRNLLHYLLEIFHPDVLEIKFTCQFDVNNAHMSCNQLWYIKV